MKKRIKLKKYRYLGYARSNTRRFMGKSKTDVLKRIRKKSPIFSKGLKYYEFEEEKKWNN